MYDEITEDEIDEIRKRDDPEDGYNIRLNWKVCLGNGLESV